MSGPFGSSQWMYKSGDYEIDNSLRFEDGSSAYLSRTPEAGNRKTWTFSTWIKRGNLGIDIDLLHAYADSGERSQLVFAADDTIKFDFDDYTANRITTTQVFRDVSAWYHIVLAVDTTQGTAANRVKIYVNGNQITDFSAASYPSENEEGHINEAIQHEISSYDGSGSYHDGYLAEVNFIEGAQKVPADFGETGDYGEWKPKKYGGAYGNEGFYLDFKSSGVGTASSSTVGADRSGNDNHWTSNNITATDQVVDTPTNNFSTMNQLANSDVLEAGTCAFSEGNLQTSWTNTDTTVVSGKTYSTVLPTTGKWYWEFNIKVLAQTTRGYVGVGEFEEMDLYGDGQNDKSYQLGVGTARRLQAYGNEFDNTFSAVEAADIWSFAVDWTGTSSKFWMRKNNGSWEGGGDPADGSDPTKTYSKTNPNSSMCPYHGAGSGSANNVSTIIHNFGQDSSFAGNKTAQGETDSNGIGDFYYEPPADYLALCTSNLPDVAIIPSEYFNTVIYTGTGSSNAQNADGITGGVDFLWTKCRSHAKQHILVDDIRGGNNNLMADSTEVENSASNRSITLGDSSFTLNSNSGHLNENAKTYVSWMWRANGSGGSNTTGSINSTVSANADAGFSIVSYTGNATSGATVGHGLSKAPQLILLKSRSAVTDFVVYSETIGAGKFLRLSSHVAADTSSAVFNDTAPTSSVFSLGNNSDPNSNGEPYIAYCFHSVDGYSKVGSYNGNGAADGVFVNTGFRPAFILCKHTSSGQSWQIHDTKRDTFNLAKKVLFPDIENVEQDDAANGACDITSNGFKWRMADADQNGNNALYTFLAIAETPFKHANAR